ncbi:hypothetical protein Pmar_PMAR009851 [Perkinsus marinus ATCC 50983]|uniref:Uncharacterized protein n=1 Tax=Perkinsus marinus (strain ATCC 50983 / TXsc) TaxID=423536 RepID=C5KV90_PERM5|nr:hypothetical protein Pmar_PMAR009851 [Perkinsus marinus ATCC 50983]EER11636.1 hypothetical protein Pmar_PMAR009851 [Perkinsus marinus ATCC 50983]|eukprot:XP_002779841.1 hypothetical protein Pmar_PMAR009851 [Perkinsus marinus ATCC 50983]
MPGVLARLQELLNVQPERRGDNLRCFFDTFNQQDPPTPVSARNYDHARLLISMVWYVSFMTVMGNCLMSLRTAMLDIPPSGFRPVLDGFSKTDDDVDRTEDSARQHWWRCS